MHDFLLFLGRFHVLALHLPIGIVIVAVALDFTARRARYRALARAAPLLWGAAALSALLTVALGYLHFAEGEFAVPSGYAHRLFGTLTALVMVLGWWLAARGPAGSTWLRLGTGVVALVLVTITGHYGGNLTHGKTFLIEYAPAPLRGLLGAAERRPRPASVAEADPYLDVVKPLLEQRCGTCHNANKRSGSFTIASYASTLAGGDTGLAVVPRNLPASELYWRITRAPDDEEFMPAEGKTPLTADQVAILKWWIESGAPWATTVGALGADPAVADLLAAQLGLGPATPATDAGDALTAQSKELPAQPGQ